MNSLATEILDAAADTDDDRRSRLRARAAALGVLREVSAASHTNAAQREKIIASTKGLGPLIDRLLAEDRERG